MRTSNSRRTRRGMRALNTSLQSLQRAGLSILGRDSRLSERSIFGRSLLFSSTHSDALVGQTVKSILACPDPALFPATFESDDWIHGIRRSANRVLSAKTHTNYEVR